MSSQEIVKEVYFVQDPNKTQESLQSPQKSTAVFEVLFKDYLSESGIEVSATENQFESLQETDENLAPTDNESDKPVEEAASDHETAGNEMQIDETIDGSGLFEDDELSNVVSDVVDDGIDQPATSTPNDEVQQQDTKSEEDDSAIAKSSDLMDNASKEQEDAHVATPRVKKRRRRRALFYPKKKNNRKRKMEEESMVADEPPAPTPPVKKQKVDLICQTCGIEVATMTILKHHTRKCADTSSTKTGTGLRNGFKPSVIPKNRK